jgi:acyl carrier protein
MTKEEKIKLLENALELGENTLKEDTNLSEISEFDSMAKLTLIVLFDDEFGKKLTGEQINQFKTVKDILDYMD